MLFMGKLLFRGSWRAIYRSLERVKRCTTMEARTEHRMAPALLRIGRCGIVGWTRHKLQYRPRNHTDVIKTLQGVNSPIVRECLYKAIDVFQRSPKSCRREKCVQVVGSDECSKEHLQAVLRENQRLEK
jgi:hypothetical protein